MPAFPRGILPKSATWPSVPTGMVSTSRSGKVQRRTTTQVGRSWTETYGPYLKSHTTFRAWLAQVEGYYSQQTAVTVYHPSMQALLGAGGGTPLVNGAGQTGPSLITDGWPASTPVLRGGDIFTIGAETLVRTVRLDATTNASGQVTLTIDPPLYVAPADNAALTLNNPAGTVRFTAYISALSMASASEDEYYSGLSLTFTELP